MNIDTLIKRREKLTNRRDGWIDWRAVNRIVAQLAQVPPGTDNRVDLALGRPCAELPKRVVLVQHVDGAQEVDPAWTVAQAEQFRLMSEGRPDGINEHDDRDAGMWM